MNFKRLLILGLLIMLNSSAEAEYVNSTSISSGSSTGNRLRIISLEDTLTYYDQELGRFIIVTNTKNSAELRIIITDLKHNPLKVFKVSDSSRIIPYTMSYFDFYPTRIVGGETKPGILIIGTSRGDIIVDTYKLESKFVIFNRDYFSGSSYETIPVQETKQIIKL